MKEKELKKITKNLKKFIENQKPMDSEFKRIADEFIEQQVNNLPKKKRF